MKRASWGIKTSFEKRDPSPTDQNFLFVNKFGLVEKPAKSMQKLLFQPVSDPLKKG